MARVPASRTVEMLVLDPVLLVADKARNFCRDEADYGDLPQFAEWIAKSPPDANGAAPLPPISVLASTAGRYEVAVGYRRTLAAQLAVEKHGWRGHIKAELLGMGTSDEDRVLLNLNENDRHKGCSPLGRMRAFQALAGIGLDVAAISVRTGHARDFVRDHLKLATASPAVQEALRAGTVTWAVVRQVLRARDHEEQEKLLGELKDATQEEAREVAGRRTGTTRGPNDGRDRKHRAVKKRREPEVETETETETGTEEGPPQRTHAEDEADRWAREQEQEQEQDDVGAGAAPDEGPAPVPDGDASGEYPDGEADPWERLLLDLDEREIRVRRMAARHKRRVDRQRIEGESAARCEELRWVRERIEVQRDEAQARQEAAS